MNMEENMTEKNTMPVIFTGHGSPMNAIGENRARDGWKKMGKELGQPKFIAAVSSHWMTEGLCVRRSDENPQIFDMYGFPDELYQIHYEPAGSTMLADRVLEALNGTASVNNDWGIDHGIWSVLCNMYPKADIPVIMISTDTTASPKEQYETGKKLAQLRDEGALILASGNIVHNLGMVSWGSDHGYEWAENFDRTIKAAVLTHQFDIPVNYQALPNASKAVPTSEHYNPFLVALGAASADDQVTVWNDYRELGSMSMTSYRFG